MEAIDHLSLEQILELLAKADIEIEGLVPWGSNYTFLVRLCHETVEAQGIYKPRRGERPLWDFPAGTLCLRERAAFLLSQTLGWDIVPPTLIRPGPQGIGSLQYFIDHDPDHHYFTLKEQFAASPTESFLNDAELPGQFVRQTQKIALFDLIINNADRKGGHVILDKKGHLWAIDHGVCFHADYKLRTVIWDFAGQPIPPALLQDIVCLADQGEQKQAPLMAALGQLLSKNELKAMQNRVQHLLDLGSFPEPGPGRHYPWPLV
ncbi:MAG: SCO1664 family protein [Anaerolineae bacterium]|nr:SCO1664 family protein [Anaerolineae bacterium]